MLIKFNVLAPICTSSSPTSWSNPNLDCGGKEPTQYWFSTKRLPTITDLYLSWYKEIDGKFIKVLPFNIEELLTPIALAHTYKVTTTCGDGYKSIEMEMYNHFHCYKSNLAKDLMPTSDYLSKG